MSEQYAHERTDFRIARSVLQDIVRGAVASDERVEIHHAGVMRGPGVEIDAGDGLCSVTMHLEARFGQDLQILGRDVQRAVGEAVESMTGLDVETVDVVFCAVQPPTSVG